MPAEEFEPLLLLWLLLLLLNVEVCRQAAAEAHGKLFGFTAPEEDEDEPVATPSGLAVILVAQLLCWYMGARW